MDAVDELQRMKEAHAVGWNICYGSKLFPLLANHSYHQNRVGKNEQRMFDRSYEYTFRIETELEDDFILHYLQGNPVEYRLHGSPNAYGYTKFVDAEHRWDFCKNIYFVDEGKVERQSIRFPAKNNAAIRAEHYFTTKVDRDDKDREEAREQHRREVRAREAFLNSSEYQESEREFAKEFDNLMRETIHGPVRHPSALAKKFTNPI